MDKNPGFLGPLGYSKNDIKKIVKLLGTEFHITNIPTSFYLSIFAAKARISRTQYLLPYLSVVPLSAKLP